MRTVKEIGLLFSLLLIPISASAQFGASAVVTVPGSVTSDAAAEQNTAGILQNTTGILTQDTITATSVSTDGGGGDYQPNAQYIASLDQGLFSGINTQNFNQWFPGWVPLPTDSTVSVAQPMASTVLTTYGQALAVAQSQEQELEGESFTNIETTLSSTTDLLTAVQAVGEAQLQTAEEIQYLRQLVATLITVEATKGAEVFNEKAQEEATNDRRWNGGVEPGQ